MRRPRAKEYRIEGFGSAARCRTSGFRARIAQTRDLLLRAIPVVNLKLPSQHRGGVRSSWRGIICSKAVNGNAIDKHRTDRFVQIWHTSGTPMYRVLEDCREHFPSAITDIIPRTQSSRHPQRIALASLLDSTPTPIERQIPCPVSTIDYKATFFPLS